MPGATGRDGTPPSFVVLATADLRHWRRYGQGGMATMGVFSLGAGTVFTASTVNWGNTLHDPVVDRITRNVLNRLASPVNGWEVIGPRDSIRALTVCDSQLYGVGGTTSCTAGTSPARTCAGSGSTPAAASSPWPPRERRPPPGPSACTA